MWDWDTINNFTMERGKSWDIDKTKILADLRIRTTEDLVSGNDQCSKVFHETVYHRFAENIPDICAGVRATYRL